jgi:hypothetical protein
MLSGSVLLNVIGELLSYYECMRYKADDRKASPKEWDMNVLGRKY